MAGLDWTILAHATLVLAMLFVAAEMLLTGQRTLVRFCLGMCLGTGILVLSRAAAVESRELVAAGFALVGLAGLLMLVIAADVLATEMARAWMLLGGRTQRDAVPASPRAPSSSLSPRAALRPEPSPDGH